MIIGLDIGSSNSCAAYWDGHTARMVELNQSGAILLPSAVCITDGQAFVGQEAVEKGRRAPDYLFQNFKRRINEQWNENEDTGYQTCEGPDGLLHYQGPGEGITYSPVDLYSYLISALVNAANDFLHPHDTVTGAVICVPADFTPSQIEGVKEAARLAELDNYSIIEEPVAAALANNVDGKKARRYIVVDLGGGTLDLSGIASGSGLVRVIAKNGIRDLGGVDWDNRLSSYIGNLFRTEYHDEIASGDLQDLATKDAALVRLQVEAEETKKRLSDKDKTEFRVLDIATTLGGKTRHAVYPVDQRTFEELTRDLRDRILAACRALMDDMRRADPNFSLKDIHDVLLVGGMTRCPSVRTVIAEFFGKTPKKDGVPEQVVALGAAMKAAILEGRRPDVTVSNVTNHAFGIETVNNIPAILIPRNKPYPFEEQFTLSNPEDEQTELSIRWLVADRPRATDCEVIWAAEVPLEPCEAETARIPMVIKMDDAGAITVRCLEQVFEGAA